MVHFKQLLENRPDYWVAMARLIEVMRRTGNLEKIPEYLTKSEDFVGTRASLEPGLNFCKGMYEWYAGNANDALKLFNKARKDQEWGQRAIYNMIELHCRGIERLHCKRPCLWIVDLLLSLRVSDAPVVH